MGERLAGKYDVVDHLATGGMAEVYLARVRGPGDFERRLVIKRVLPSLAAEEEFTRLFEAEACYAALIEHPHVAQVYDFGRDERGLPFLAMEYVDGASLRELFKAAAARGERSDPRLVAWVFARVAEGLAAAHALVDPRTRQPLHLVHRDVSPDNVLVSRLGAVKVSDFGIARAMVKAGTTRPDQLRGKLRYLSPEQILGEAPTLAVDVWAMGVCLYEALAGQRPFPEGNEGQLVDAIAKGLRTPLDALRPDVPRELVAVVDRCLEVDVARRMPDCQELALALHRTVSTSGPLITTAMVGGWVDRLVPARGDGRGERWLPELVTSSGAEPSPAARRAEAMGRAPSPVLDEDDLRPTPVAPTVLDDEAATARTTGLPATRPLRPETSAPVAATPHWGRTTSGPLPAPRATPKWVPTTPPSRRRVTREASVLRLTTPATWGTPRRSPRWSGLSDVASASSRSRCWPSRASGDWRGGPCVRRRRSPRASSSPASRRAPPCASRAASSARRRGRGTSPAPRPSTWKSRRRATRRGRRRCRRAHRRASRRS